MATSPGRSAIQTTPKASTATSARKMRTRIIDRARFSRRRLQRSDGVGGEPPAGVERLVARLGLGDPGLHRRAGFGRKLGELRQSRRRCCPARRAARRAPGSRRDRRRASPRRPGGCGRASRRWPAAGRGSRRRAAAAPAARSIGRTMRGKLLAERRIARHAGGRERLKQRDRIGVGRERLDDGELGGERIAVLDRVAQRRRRDGEPRGAVAAGGG